MSDKLAQVWCDKCDKPSTQSYPAHKRDACIPMQPARMATPERTLRWMSTPI